MRKAIRIHDKLYLKENRYKNTKESFKLLIKILKNKIKKFEKYTLLDVGCANGELIYNLEKEFSNIEFTGLDVRKDLIKKAKRHVSKKVKFLHRDITTKKIIKKKYDIIICAGVLAIFDNYKTILSNLSKLLKKDGEIYLFGNFNIYDFDVLIKYKDLNKNPNNLQSGWNIWSLLTIRKFFKNKKIKLYKFYINKKISPKKNDPVRSWTINIKNKNYFTNALSIIQRQFWIRIY